MRVYKGQLPRTRYTSQAIILLLCMKVYSNQSSKNRTENTSVGSPQSIIRVRVVIINQSLKNSKVEHQMLIINNIVKIAISSSKRKVNLRPVLLAKKLHEFATKTYYVHGFRYNFSNPVILFAKKYSVVEKENNFLAIGPNDLLLLHKWSWGELILPL